MEKEYVVRYRDAYTKAASRLTKAREALAHIRDLKQRYDRTENRWEWTQIFIDIEATATCALKETKPEEDSDGS